MSNDDDDGYELVMPFLPVESKGGPFRDQDYVAGYEVGRLDALLASGQVPSWPTMQAANRGQIDLIAMRHGYRAHITDTDWPDQWVNVTLTREGAPSDG